VFVGVFIGLLLISSIPSLYNTLFLNEVWTLTLPVASLLIPFSIGFSVLRYRLYDIDVLINRTLVYGTLTVLLALLYVGLVIGLGALVRLFTGQVSQSPIVIVTSTLAIAALFQPLRHRLQAMIDRRFYRRKYDAAKTWKRSAPRCSVCGNRRVDRCWRACKTTCGSSSNSCCWTTSNRSSQPRPSSSRCSWPRPACTCW
jgi:hypothetical protein